MDSSFFYFMEKCIVSGMIQDGRKAMEQKKTPLLDAIVEYTKKRPVYFKIPGHRYEKGISPRWKKWTGDGIFRFDLTEAEGLDDLHCPQGVIKEAQDLAAEVFQADRTYFLVNGTTCGNEAMVLGCAGEGEKILVARNVHKSVLMGLILSGADPVYLMPEYDEKTGLWGSVKPETVEEGFRQNPDCKGVFIVSPTYYGVCSDLEKISRICHSHGAVLMVDEAHGGHLYFGREGKRSNSLPRGAMLSGADICAQSMHKVTGSLGQSSLLHMKSSGIDQGKLESALQMVQSTSPSYLLMTSLDAARYELALHGEEMIEKTCELTDYAREKINQISGISCYGEEILGDKIFQLDTTRLVLSASKLGITGFELADILYENYGIGMELSDEKNVVAVVTYANEMEDMERLVKAMEDIAGKRKITGEQQEEKWKIPSVPPFVMNPRKAYFAKKKTILWKDAVGQIGGEALIPYPPGIPILNPGEIVTEEIWNYMEEYRKKGLHFHGPADNSLETFQIILSEG